MVSGTLALKNGYYYAVLSYQDAAGKRHQKWVSTGLPQKGNKRRAEQELIRIRSEFEIPPAAGELNSNMLFADYLDQWLEVVRARIKPATFGSYQGMVKSTIGPYRLHLPQQQFFSRQHLLPNYSSLCGCISVSKYRSLECLTTLI